LKLIAAPAEVVEAVKTDPLKIFGLLGILRRISTVLTGIGIYLRVILATKQLEFCCQTRKSGFLNDFEFHNPILLLL
jgi:hypothetical protein